MAFHLPRARKAPRQHVITTPNESVPPHRARRLRTSHGKTADRQTAAARHRHSRRNGSRGKRGTALRPGTGTAGSATRSRGLQQQARIRATPTNNVVGQRQLQGSIQETAEGGIVRLLQKALLTPAASPGNKACLPGALTLKVFSTVGRIHCWPRLVMTMHINTTSVHRRAKNRHRMASFLDTRTHACRRTTPASPPPCFLDPGYPGSRRLWGRRRGNRWQGQSAPWKIQFVAERGRSQEVEAIAEREVVRI